jgi:hypothetical protein
MKKKKTFFFFFNFTPFSYSLNRTRQKGGKISTLRKVKSIFNEAAPLQAAIQFTFVWLMEKATLVLLSILIIWVLVLGLFLKVAVLLYKIVGQIFLWIKVILMLWLVSERGKKKKKNGNEKKKKYKKVGNGLITRSFREWLRFKMNFIVPLG